MRLREPQAGLLQVSIPQYESGQFGLVLSIAIMAFEMLFNMSQFLGTNQGIRTFGFGQCAVVDGNESQSLSTNQGNSDKIEAQQLTEECYPNVSQSLSRNQGNSD